jgi:hypothetical protein
MKEKERKTKTSPARKEGIAHDLEVKTTTIGQEETTECNTGNKTHETEKSKNNRDKETEESTDKNNKNNTNKNRRVPVVFSL